MKEIKKDIIISGDELNTWFKTMMKKYPNSNTWEYLESVWRMMSGATLNDDSLKTFFKKT